jgi:hypothetical protein
MGSNPSHSAKQSSIFGILQRDVLSAPQYLGVFRERMWNEVAKRKEMERPAPLGRHTNCRPAQGNAPRPPFNSPSARGASTAAGSARPSMQSCLRDKSALMRARKPLCACVKRKQRFGSETLCANTNGKSLTPKVPLEFRFAGSQDRASKGQHIKSRLYVRAENGLRLRDRKIGHLVEKMRSVMPWLEESDIPACRAWAQCEVMVDMTYAILRKVSIINAQGEPRRLLADFVRLRNFQLQYAREPAMTPAAKIAIKVNGQRAPLDLALARSQGETEDIETVEGV